MERPRDHAYEALAEVTNAHMEANRGELNVALKSIRAQTEIEDAYLLAVEIHEKAEAYRAAMPEVMLTPTALAKHWTRVEHEATARRPPVPATNQATPATECDTCGGDRFVPFALRKPTTTIWMQQRGIKADEAAMIEEMAPCPHCNSSADTGFRRHDGSYAHPPDPAQVSARLA